jgi:hypothetical protein
MGKAHVCGTHISHGSPRFLIREEIMPHNVSTHIMTTCRCMCIIYSVRAQSVCLQWAQQVVRHSKDQAKASLLFGVIHAGT